MRKTLLVGAAAAVGYVLGARAGRPAYDRMVAGWHRTRRAWGLDELSSRVTRSAVDLRDAAKDRAATQAEDLMDRATEVVSPSGESVSAADQRAAAAQAHSHGYAAGSPNQANQAPA